MSTTLGKTDAMHFFGYANRDARQYLITEIGEVGEIIPGTFDDLTSTSVPSAITVPKSWCLFVFPKKNICGSSDAINSVLVTEIVPMHAEEGNRTYYSELITSLTQLPFGSARRYIYETLCAGDLSKWSQDKHLHYDAGSATFSTNSDSGHSEGVLVLDRADIAQLAIETLSRQLQTIGFEVQFGQASQSTNDTAKASIKSKLTSQPVQSLISIIDMTK